MRRPSRLWWKPEGYDGFHWSDQHRIILQWNDDYEGWDSYLHDSDGRVEAQEMRLFDISRVQDAVGELVEQIEE